MGSHPGRRSFAQEHALQRRTEKKWDQQSVVERGLIAEKISGVNLCGRQGPTTTDRTWALRVGPFSSQKNHPESGVVCRYFEIIIVT